jgi:hypothetical protein
MLPTVQELGFKFSKSHWLSPYGIVAFELDNQADGGTNEGVYLELGASPSWPLADGKVTVAVPVKAGFSLSDYYELSGEDHKFGYLNIGGLATVPFTSPSSKFGAWNVHGGLEFYTFGDTTKFFNNDNSTKVVVSVGVGVVY